MMPNKIEQAFIMTESKIKSSSDDPRKYKTKIQGGGVCKFWLENRCKKGETCEYIHQIIMNK